MHTHDINQMAGKSQAYMLPLACCSTTRTDTKNLKPHRSLHGGIPLTAQGAGIDRLSCHSCQHMKVDAFMAVQVRALHQGVEWKETCSCCVPGGITA